MLISSEKSQLKPAVKKKRIRKTTYPLQPWYYECCLKITPAWIRKWQHQNLWVTSPSLIPLLKPGKKTMKKETGMMKMNHINQLWGQPAVTADVQKVIEVIRTWMEMTENNSDLVPGLQKIERCVCNWRITKSTQQAAKLYHFLLHKWLCLGPWTPVNTYTVFSRSCDI